MHGIPPLRSMRFPDYIYHAKDPLEMCACLLSTPGAVRVFHVDPFRKLLTPLTLPTLKHSPPPTETLQFCNTHANVGGSGTELERAWSTIESVHTTPLGEDLSYGGYIGCMHKPEPEAGARAPKEPGFEIAGKFFSGHAMLVRGVEVIDPTSTLLVDNHVDLEADLQLDGVPLLSTLKWMTVAEVKQARKAVPVHVALGEAATALVGACNGARRLTLLTETMAVRVDRAATCWNCQATGTALHKCARCKAAYYCNAACQKAHWKTHKAACSAPAATSGS